jgi:hypothetical protein
MFATIQPVQVYPSTAHVLVLSNPVVSLGQSAVFTAYLKDAPEGAYLTPGTTLTMAGEAYAQWGTDDEYPYRWAAQQLGLTIIAIVPDAPAIIAPPLPDMRVPPMPVLADAVDAPAAPVAPSEEAAPAVDGGTDE